VRAGGRQWPGELHPALQALPQKEDQTGQGAHGQGGPATQETPGRAEAVPDPVQADAWHQSQRNPQTYEWKGAQAMFAQSVTLATAMN